MRRMTSVEVINHLRVQPNQHVFWARLGTGQSWVLFPRVSEQGIEYGMRHWEFYGPVLSPDELGEQEVANLDERMRKAGMIPLSEMLVSVPLGRFIANVDVVDLASFESWLKMRRAEMLGMQMRMELDMRQNDDLYEWVLAHAAVFTEVLCNLQSAQGKLPTSL